LSEKEPEASGGPYPVAAWFVLQRHGAGTFSIVATCPGMRTTMAFICCCMVRFFTCTVMRNGLNNISSQDVPGVWARDGIEAI
jgi:hypothetical protein